MPFWLSRFCASQQQEISVLLRPMTAACGIRRSQPKCTHVARELPIHHQRLTAVRSHPHPTQRASPSPYVTTFERTPGLRRQRGAAPARCQSRLRLRRLVAPAAAAQTCEIRRGGRTKSCGPARSELVRACSRRAPPAPAYEKCIRIDVSIPTGRSTLYRAGGTEIQRIRVP